MAITVNYVSQLTVVEELSGEYLGDDDTVTTNGLNTTEEFTASTAVPVSKYSAGQLTLSGGSGSIDLTSLPDANGVAGAVTFLGLKVNAYKFRNKSTNANNITIAEGASNGYPLHGASFTLTLRPGEELTYRGKDLGTDVAAGDRILDVTGTGSQILEFELVAG